MCASKIIVENMEKLDRSEILYLSCLEYAGGDAEKAGRLFVQRLGITAVDLQIVLARLERKKILPLDLTGSTIIE